MYWAINFSCFHRFPQAKDMGFLLEWKLMQENIIDSTEPSSNQYNFLLQVPFPMIRNLWSTVSTFQGFGAASENRKVGVRSAESRSVI